MKGDDRGITVYVTSDETYKVDPDEVYESEMRGFLPVKLLFRSDSELMDHIIECVKQLRDHQDFIEVKIKKAEITVEDLDDDEWIIDQYWSHEAQRDE